MLEWGDLLASLNPGRRPGDLTDRREILKPIVVCALLAAGCACESRISITSDADVDTHVAPDVPDIPSACPGGPHTLPVTLAESVMLDILVVVDNSMSMAEEQANLAASFPVLIEDLLDPPVDPGSGEPLYRPVTDMHIGVVSTDMGTGGYGVETCSDPIDGDDGILLHRPSTSVSGCDAAYPTYLSYESEEPDPEQISWISKGFGCIATLGINGCGFEQQLKAAAKALIDHRDGVNAGFLRADSFLVILFVTDEEDCSVAPGSEGIFDTMDSSLGHMNLRCFHHPYMVELIDKYIDAFGTLRSDPDRLFLAFLVGVPQGDACEGHGDEIPGCLEHPDMVEQVDVRLERGRGLPGEEVRADRAGVRGAGVRGLDLPERLLAGRGRDDVEGPQIHRGEHGPGRGARGGARPVRVRDPVQAGRGARGSQGLLARGQGVLRARRRGHGLRRASRRFPRALPLALRDPPGPDADEPVHARGGACVRRRRPDPLGRRRGVELLGRGVDEHDRVRVRRARDRVLPGVRAGGGLGALPVLLRVGHPLLHLDMHMHAC
jgi:hypothetical protein